MASQLIWRKLLEVTRLQPVKQNHNTMNREEAINIAKSVMDEMNVHIKELQDKILNLESKITQDVEQPKWIPLSERIPTEEDGWGKFKYVLVKWKNNTESIMGIDELKSSYTLYITHWARIVEPK